MTARFLRPDNYMLILSWLRGVNKDVDVKASLARVGGLIDATTETATSVNIAYIGLLTGAPYQYPFKVNNDLVDLLPHHFRP